MGLNLPYLTALTCLIVIQCGAPVLQAHEVEMAYNEVRLARQSNSTGVAADIPMPPQVTAVITGSWTGLYYYQDGRKSVEFTFRFDDAGDICRGRSDEPNTFGDNSSKRLYANIECDSVWLAPGQTVVIIKRYDQTGGISHVVRYVGTVSRDSLQITGHWEIGLTRGDFMILR